MKKLNKLQSNKYNFLPRLLLFLILSAFLFTSCLIQKSQTGRKQLMLFSDAKINASAVNAYEQVKKTNKLITKGPLYQAVQSVGKNIARAANRKDYRWEFILIDNDTTVNAWAMPGGKVAVYTGILPVAQNNAALAAILGHEVSHALARHSNERASQAAIQEILGQALSYSLRKKKSHNMWMTVFGAGTTLGFMLPYSRKQETEADVMGLDIMSRAGYDPREAPLLWERMANMNKKAPPAFLSTHPDSKWRSENLRKLLPGALQKYNNAPNKQTTQKIPL